MHTCSSTLHTRTNNIISKAIKSTYRNFITNLPSYHIDRSGDPPIHNWHDIIFFGMQTLGPMGSNLTHTQSRNLFPPWTAGKNTSSKVKGHWPRFNFVVTKTSKTKSGDHQEITHGMVLKPHKLTSYITLKHIVHIQVVSEKS